MPHRTSTNHFPWIFTSVITFFVILGFGWSFVNYLLSPVNKDLATPITFEVKRGDSQALVGENLANLGLLRHPLAFRLAVYLEDLGGKIQAGEYSLAPSMSAKQLAQTLTRGYASGIRLTIPEGFRLEQIAELAEDKLRIPYSETILHGSDKEGYLFPDTYEFKKDTTAKELIDILAKNWQNKLASLSPTHNQVILASIVEREALTKSEKPIVAGILTKRLREGWALEVDASIQYMIGRKGQWWPVPLLGDRKLPSPYNTYLNPGLPPSPIANPGLDSLSATISPQESPYYFYLHDKKGNIHYAKTYAEHNENIAKYIRSN